MARVEIFRRGSPEADSPMPGLQRRRVSGRNVMVQDVSLSPGVGAPMHSHENEQIVVMLEGRLKLVLEEGGRRREEVLRPGDIAVVPPNARHTGEALTPCRLIDIFSPPSETTGVDLPPDREVDAGGDGDLDGDGDGGGAGGGDGP